MKVKVRISKLFSYHYQQQFSLLCIKVKLTMKELISFCKEQLFQLFC